MNTMQCTIGFVVSMSILILSGCATTSPIVKTSSGNFNVIGYGSTSQRSRNGALLAATRYCRITHKQVMVINEETRYKGLISAEVNKAVKVASSVAKAAGKQEASKTIGAVASDDGYETEVNFICEPN
jgi:hypothetical protein